MVLIPARPVTIKTWDFRHKSLSPHKKSRARKREGQWVDAGPGEEAVNQATLATNNRDFNIKLLPPELIRKATLEAINKVGGETLDHKRRTPFMKQLSFQFKSVPTQN